MVKKLYRFKKSTIGQLKKKLKNIKIRSQNLFLIISHTRAPCSELYLPSFSQNAESELVYKFVCFVLHSEKPISHLSRSSVCRLSAAHICLRGFAFPYDSAPKPGAINLEESALALVWFSAILLFCPKYVLCFNSHRRDKSIALVSFQRCRKKSRAALPPTKMWLGHRPA